MVSIGKTASESRRRRAESASRYRDEMDHCGDMTRRGIDVGKVSSRYFRRARRRWW